MTKENLLAFTFFSELWSINVQELPKVNSSNTNSPNLLLSKMCFVFFAMVISQSCRSTPAESFREPALVNGDFTDLARETGLVLRYESEGLPKRCTAILADLNSKRILISAAHCMGSDPQKNQKIEVFRNKKNSEGDDVLEPVGQIVNRRIHPKYQNHSASSEDPYDIAVGVMDTDAPSAMRPITLVEASWLPGQNSLERNHVIGAGLTILEYSLDRTSALVRSAPIEGEFSVKRSSIVGSIFDMIKTSSFQAGDTLILDKPKEGSPYLCPGDSGGAFISESDSKFLLAGIISHAMTISYQGRKVCWYPVHVIPVGAHLKWLQETSAELLKNNSKN